MAGARSSSCRQHNSSRSSLAPKSLTEKAASMSSWPGFVPAIHVFPCLSAAKTWMPGIADKFTQSAQGRLLWPGMTRKLEARLGSRSHHPPFGRYPPENRLVMLA